MEEAVKGVKKQGGKKDWVNERKQDFMKSRVRGEERKRWASGNKRKRARRHVWMNTRM